MTFSIVTLSFQQAAFLPRCLATVSAQCRAGDEHLCVDPGSTDGSREIIQKAGGAVQPVFGPDKGAADGLNKGFTRARGDVLAFINADDELAPGALDWVREYFAAHPDVDMVLGAVRVIGARGERSLRKRICSEPSLAAVRADAFAFYQQGLFFRREIWDRGVRFNPDNHTCWDYEFVVDALLAGARARSVSRELGRFRVHAGSITGSGRLNARYLKDRERVRAKALAAHAESNESKNWIRLRAKIDPWRRVLEWSSVDNAPDEMIASRTPSLVQSTFRPDVVIAWQGFPFYARRSVKRLTELRPNWRIVVLADEVTDAPREVAAACGCRFIRVDSSRPLGWADLGLSAPTHFFATSWTHPAYRALGREVRTHGGATTMLADNCFVGSLRQWLGSLYFRIFIRPDFDSVWVPGRSGRRFMEVMGMPASSVADGLLAGDPAVYSSPEETRARRGVLYAGKLIPLKRVDTLWRFWRETASDIALSFAGDGPLRDTLHQEGAALEGALSPQALAERMREVSALALVSTIDHWGLVVHEAALCGCLLIVTRSCGAADDLVVHQKNGYVMCDLTPAEVTAAAAWLRSLTPAQEADGRRLSLSLACAFSPQRWAERAVAIVENQRDRQSRAIL